MARSSERDLHLTLELHNKAPSNLSSSQILSAITIPRRTLILSYPNWSVTVGRSTSSDSGPRAQRDNACFQSRVVSRDHAIITADPKTREVFIRDVGSMHGTHRDGQRLPSGCRESLFDGDKLVFGAEVARGDATFAPVEVEISYTWSDEDDIRSSSTRVNEEPRNTFSADFSDDESELEQPREIPSSERDSSIEVVEARIGFAAPESDVSDIISIVSDDPPAEQESPTSSPLCSHEQDSVEGKDAEVITIDPTDPFPIPEITLEEELLGDPEEAFSNQFKAPDRIMLSSISSLHDRPTALQATPDTFLSVEHREVRQPSPSDAAMVKSVAPVQRAPPFPPSQYDHDSFSSDWTAAFQTLDPIVKANNRNENAWAGHNSVLYESCVMPDNPFSQNQASGCQHQQQPSIAPWRKLPVPTETRMPEDEMPEERHVRWESSVGKGKKRKLDDIEPDVIDPTALSYTDEGTLNTTLNPTEAQAVPSVSFEWQPNDLIPLEVTQSIESLKSPPPSVIESPRKKHKKNKEDRGARHAKKGSGFMRVAATALAGAAIGAVGTVFALASLPQDFFV